MLKKLFYNGEILLLSFVLISSMQEVFLGHYTQGKDPLALVGSIFLITVVFYFLVHIKHFEPLVKALKNNQSTIFCLNCSTAVAWIGYFFSVKFIEPAIGGVVAFCVGP